MILFTNDSNFCCVLFTERIFFLVICISLFFDQEMYQQFLDGDDVKSLGIERDPFWEPIEDMLIGTGIAFLQSLSFALDFDDKLTITDYNGLEEGHLIVRILPCDRFGKPLDDDSFVDDPSELLGKPYSFKVGAVNLFCVGFN